jgi:hypothetical protein
VVLHDPTALREQAVDLTASFLFRCHRLPTGFPEPQRI